MTEFIDVCTTEKAIELAKVQSRNSKKAYLFIDSATNVLKSVIAGHVVAVVVTGNGGGQG